MSEPWGVIVPTAGVTTHVGTRLSVWAVKSRTEAVNCSVSELPTVAEDALPGFESNQWWGMYGPAGMPTAVVAKLNAELNKILQTADIKERLATDGAQPGGGSPDDLASYLRRDYEQWGKVIKAAGITGE